MAIGVISGRGGLNAELKCSSYIYEAYKLKVTDAFIFPIS